MTTEKEDKEERRRRKRGAIAPLLRRVKEVCDAVGKVDNIAELIDDVVTEVGDFVKAADLQDLLDETHRSRIRDAVDLFRDAKGNIDTLDDACSKLTKALEAAEEVLGAEVGEEVPGAEGSSQLSTLFKLVGGLAALAGVVIIAFVLIDGGEDGNGPGVTEDPVDGPGVPAGIPTDPSDVFSPSHEVDVASDNPEITMAWSFHEDAAAYSVDWTPFLDFVPDTIPDLGGDATEVTSVPLPDDNWWFHLRTQGHDEDWTSTVHIGPFVISTCPELHEVVLEVEDLEFNNEKFLFWGTDGGCEPYSVIIEATYDGEDEAYETYELGSADGQQTDEPPIRCEGTFGITYSIEVSDGVGHTTHDEAFSSAQWLC